MTADSALKNGILFVANGKSEIDVVMKKLLAETETSSTEDNATIWRIKTKYYEADVELISFQACDISKAASSVAQRIDALVLIFDEHKIHESFYPLLQWFQSDAFDPAVCLCVGINSSLVDHKKAVTVDGELFDSVEDFCLDRMFEYIDYDEEDSVKRFIEALQTNIWDGHIAVDNKKAEAQDFAFSSELKQLEQMFGKMARDNSAEAEQDADREEDEFDLGVLLSKLKDIREKCNTLPVDEKHMLAEKVALSFASQFGVADQDVYEPEE